MTNQIKEILESLFDDDYYEDEAVILKTYIERLEAPKTCDGCVFWNVDNFCVLELTEKECSRLFEDRYTTKENS